MADPVIRQSEQNAGVAAATAIIDASVPGMFRGYIHDDMIASIVYDVLVAAAKARIAEANTSVIGVVKPHHDSDKTKANWPHG